MLSLPLSARCVRPWAVAAQKLPKVTKSTTSHMSSAGSEPTRAAAATRDAPAKVGVYAGGKEMPFTSVLRIEDPDKLPVRYAYQPVQVIIAPANTSILFILSIACERRPCTLLCVIFGGFGCFDRCRATTAASYKVSPLPMPQRIW